MVLCMEVSLVQRLSNTVMYYRGIRTSILNREWDPLFRGSLIKRGSFTQRVLIREGSSIQRVLNREGVLYSKGSLIERGSFIQRALNREGVLYSVDP